MGGKPSHDQTRRAKLEKRAERARLNESLAHMGNMYKVEEAVESLVIQPRGTLPPTRPRRRRASSRPGGHELIIANIHVSPRSQVPGVEPRNRLIAEPGLLLYWLRLKTSGTR